MFSESLLTTKVLDKLLISLPLKLFREPVMQNVLGRKQKGAKRALLYFKVEAFCSKRLRDGFKHTNNSEIYEMARALDQRGFVVDVIDRTATWEEISQIRNLTYDLYISNAAGNSAHFHTQILGSFNLKKKVLFAAGPEPTLSNLLVNTQHDNFKIRNKVDCIVRRLVNGNDFADRFKGLDAIFYIGNEFSRSTYEKYSPNLFRINPSSSPALKLEPDEVNLKSSKRFIYLGGTGLICKGLDLLLEAFDGLHNLNLDICGPADEKDFWDYYAPLMLRNPQIKFHGFVNVTGSLFQELSSKAAFYVFPSCAEGCATSVTTCMRRGIVPVVNREVGIDTGDFGVKITDRNVPALRTLIQGLSEMPDTEMKRRVLSTYKHSEIYTTDGFRKSFSDALDGILK